MKKLVIIPAFNESASIERAVDDIRQNAPGFDYIVICPESQVLSCVSTFAA